MYFINKCYAPESVIVLATAAISCRNFNWILLIIYTRNAHSIKTLTLKREPQVERHWHRAYFIQQITRAFPSSEDIQ